MPEYTKYEVGQPMPGAYPTSEGGFLEIERGGGLVLFIQFPGLTSREAKAFKDLRRYYYLEPADMPVPLTFWIFEFAKPLERGIECNMDARLYDVPRVEAWLDTTEGIKNMLTLYLLDGPTLRGIKTVGLRHEAVLAFHATLRKQLATPYNNADYMRCLRGLEAYSVEELKQMAKKFKL